MKDRKIPILDTYFHKVDEIIWPRFSTIFEHFLVNVKQANAAQFIVKDLNIHYTTKRYVTLAQILYKIAYKTGQNMLISRLCQFQTNMINFI